MLIPDHPVPSTGGGSLKPFSSDVKTDQMGVLSPSFGLWNKAGQQGFLKACLERERERLDGILNKNDRLCFKLNKNKLSEEYIEVACVLPLERFIFICLSMDKGGR